MKNEMPDEPLDALLQEWKIDAEPPPRFREGVWRRIAQRECGAAAPRPADRVRWIFGLKPRAELAWGLAAALVAILGAGWLGFRNSPPPASVPDPGSYLASVDPYRMIP